MKLAEFSVKNSLLVNSISVFLVVSGLLALFRIEREAFPNFSFDIIIVSTPYKGAPPEVIEKRIAIPLEKELKEVDDIKKLYSVSVEGLSEIILEIEPDAPDKTKVFNDIQKAVDEASDLPIDLDEDPKVLELKTRDTPLVTVSLSGDIPETELREIAKNLETEILDLSGVSTVSRDGMRDREIWVELDPEKMESHHIALSQVMQVLANRNINIAGGLFKGEQGELILRTSGELETSEEIRHVILRVNEEGYGVTVGDVANVVDSFEEEKIIQKTDGQRAINLMVIKKDKADAIRLKEDLTVLIENFKERNDQKLEVSFIDDISYYIKRRLNVLLGNGWIGLIFVMIPMVLFLSGRVAIGALAGMAVALLSAIAAMNFFGISINLISMFGLIMVLGMLVDEDLVIADNISRYLEEGKSHIEAAILGTSEVMSGIFSTVLTTIIAFVPLLFMSGIFGKFIGDIPKVVIITLLASLVEALIILPSHISDLSRPTKHGRVSSFEKKRQHHYFDRFREKYLKSLRFCLKHPIWTTGISFGAIFGAILLAVFGLKFVLFPAKGIEAFFIRAGAPIGTSLERMENLMQPLEELVMKLPKNELDHVVTKVGITQFEPGDPFTERGSHLGQLGIYLTPETRRDRDADQIMQALREKVQNPSALGFERVNFDAVPPGPPVGKPVAVRIRGDHFAELDAIAHLFKNELKTMDGVRDIRDDYEEGKGELSILVNEKRALQAGLSYQEIASTVRQAFNGMVGTTIRKTDDEIDVVVKLPEEKRHDLTAITSLLILNKTGDLIRLSDVAQLEEVPGVSMIKHFDRKRVVTVTANIDDEKITSQEVNKHLKKKFGTTSHEHPGVTFTYGGEDEDTQESMQSLFRALFAAMLMIFIVLLVTFGNFLQTFIIMLAVPFGLVGVVIGFGIAGEPIGFLAFLGVIGLTGIVVDGGTLIFLFINRLRKDGIVDLKEAILKGCEVRFRSILLTTMTTVFGVIPAAYGIGGSDPFIRPMALALNWGIGVSIFFTLYTVPCLYYLADKVTIKMRSKLPWKLNGNKI